MPLIYTVMDVSSFNFDVREYRIYQDDTLESPAADSYYTAENLRFPTFKSFNP